MYKKLLFVLLLSVSFTACNKTNKNSGCGANQVCTEEFASIGIGFTDTGGNNVSVKDITVTNLRTGLAIEAKNVIDPGFSPDYRTIATDANKAGFSAAGDEVKVTATRVSTNKTASAVLKISGGCNCHIAKLSGPANIVFE